MSNYDDPRLRGRYPEFARMSLNPGLGRDAMFEVADALLRHPTTFAVDVPASLRHGSGFRPLGRYLRSNLRKFVGRDEKTPQEVVDEMDKKMLPVRMAAFDASESYRDKILEVNTARRLSVVGRAKIRKARRGL